MIYFLFNCALGALAFLGVQKYMQYRQDKKHPFILKGKENE